MTITAWYMDDIESDQRLPHQKTIIPDLDVIAKLGVLHWSGITGWFNYSTFCYFILKKSELYQ